MFEWIRANEDIAVLVIASLVILAVLAFFILLIAYLASLWLRVRNNSMKKQFQLHVRDQQLKSGFDVAAKERGTQRRHRGYEADRLHKEARADQLREKQLAQERQGIQAFPRKDGPEN